MTCPITFISMMKNKICFNEAHSIELKEINRLRKMEGRDPCGSEDPDINNELIGLSLSGGGIRSASFCIGVLSNLADRGLLKRIDCISAVSGGCYALGNLMAIAKAYHDGDLQKNTKMTETSSDASTAAHSATLRGLQSYPHGNSIGRPESIETQHLRASTSYLLSDSRADRLAVPWLFAANIVINLLMLAPLIFLFALIWNNFFGHVPLKLLVAHWSGKELSELEIVAMIFSTSAAHLKISLFLFLFFIIIKILIKNPSKLWSRRITRAGGLWTYSFGIIFLLEFNSLVVYLTSIYFDFDVSTETKNAVNLITYSVVLILVLAGVLSAAVVFVVNRILSSGNFSHHFFAYLLGLLGPIVFGLILSTFSRWLISEKAPPSYLKSITKSISNLENSALEFFLGLIGKIYEITTVARYFIVTLFVDPWAYDITEVNLFRDQYVFQLSCIVAAIACYLFCRTLNANHTSLHRFYRSRLGDTFLSIKSADGKLLSSQTDTKLIKFQEVNIPVCLINVSANSTQFHGFQKYRKAKRFVLSAWACGFDDEFVKTDVYQFYDNDLDLGAAVAISGAAASSHMGNLTRRYFVMLFALLNIRLGYWAVNPKAISESKFEGGQPQFKSRKAGARYFARELFSAMPETAPYINLSDGGHSDNLGVLSLIKRKCRVIIAVDSERDPIGSFTGLANVVKCARRDHNVDIDISTDVLSQDENGFSDQHFSIGLINYSSTEKGVLIYIKSSLTSDENEYVRAYKRSYSAFPHESTANQFFSEVQFEVYRSLGYHVSNSTFEDLDVNEIVRTHNLTGT